MKLWVLLGVLGLTGSLHAELVNRSYAGSLVSKLEAKGFTCKSQVYDKASHGQVNLEGSVCTIAKVNVPGFRYSQPIAILVPHGVSKPNHMLLHFHGNRGICEPAGASSETLATEFDFLSQMKTAGASHSVMILPMSKGQAKTYEKELIPNFAAFKNWAVGTVEPANDRWTVSAHSSGGRVAAAILSQYPRFTRRVRSAILLDAAFSMKLHVAQWQAAKLSNPKLVVYSVYNSKETRDNSMTLHAALNNTLRGGRSQAARHCEVPKRDYAEWLGASLKNTQPRNKGFAQMAGGTPSDATATN